MPFVKSPARAVSQFRPKVAGIDPSGYSGVDLSAICNGSEAVPAAMSASSHLPSGSGQAAPHPTQPFNGASQRS